ncbi:hypothetical protein [Paenibacillus rhizolycopersici]|uniref:hypothetical protein n=1 Tax=Paenibacillus rhizolycopersici TaxID=2780073 RepID=UPI003D28782C
MPSRYGGITGTEQIANDYQNINTAFEAVEADVDAKATIVTNHINSTAAHTAEHITYSGSADGTNVKDAIDTIDERVDTIIQGGGPDKDAELVDIRTPDPSYTPSRAINVAGDIVRDMQEQFGAQLADLAVDVKRFGAVGDGTIDDTEAINNAVSACLVNGYTLNWGTGTYLTTASIPNFHKIRHTGNGVVKRGDNTYTVTPYRTTVNKLFVSPLGSEDNDGLSDTEPRKTIQGIVDLLHKYGPIVGRVQIFGAAGTYSERVVIPDGLAIENNYLEFRFPSTPGIQGEPTTWTGAILDGSGFNSGVGFEIGKYNKVYVEYLLFKNWEDPILADNQQTMSACVMRAFSFSYFYGCSGIDNGYNTFYLYQHADAEITGGIIDGGRHAIDNVGGRLSLSKNGTSETDCTIIRNAREYGLYAKHQSSTVMDYIRFEDCGKTSGFSADGAAIFGYKSNTSIDTRQAVFRRNNICYHMRGAYISPNPSTPDIYGAGADANNRIWKITGYGADDIINYQSLAPREKVRVFTEASTTSTTLTNVIDTLAVIPAGYLVSQDQYLEIFIQGVNNSASAAQVRPILVSTQPQNYALGTYEIPANAHFVIRLLIYPTDGANQTVLYNNNNATISSNAVGFTSTTMPLALYNHTFKVQGAVPSSTLVIKKTRCILWG